MKRIVVIDDSEIVLESVKAALAPLDCEVVGMTEPTRQVVQKLRPIDLVLMDVHMPQGFGDDVSVLFKEAWGVVAPIYLYSSLPERELVVRCHRAGADGYICKDWGTDRLASTVREVLGLRDGRCKTDLAGADPDDDAARSIYRRFAERCRRRQAQTNVLLERAEAAGPAAELLDDLGRALHDWIGEARLLGFDRLSSAVAMLNEVLGSWAKGFTPPLHSPRLSAWIETLCVVSEKLALQAPTSEVDQKLQSFRTELEAELGSSEFDSSRTPASSKSLTRRILVLDDSPIVGEVLSLELESRGHRVARAATLAEFECRLADFAPEVIFLDINMPDIKGDDLCRWLRRQPQTRNVPVILLSSLKDEELAELARKAKADGYLSKQSGMDELIRYLDDLLLQVVF